MTSSNIANYKVINTIRLGHISSGNFPYIDSQYRSDITILENNSLYYTSNYIWLASRDATLGSSYSDYHIRKLYPYSDDTVVGSSSLYYVDSSGSVESSSDTCGVVPIITLKPGISISGGSGTSDSPYTITY